MSRAHYAKRIARATCHYCGINPATTIDHIVPKAMGGPYAFWNMQPACVSCNSQKKSDWPTCECEKCQTAIVRFMSEDEWLEQAIKFFDKKVYMYERQIQDILAIKIPHIESRKAEAIESRKVFEASLHKNEVQS